MPMRQRPRQRKRRNMQKKKLENRELHIRNKNAEALTQPIQDNSERSPKGLYKVLIS